MISRIVRVGITFALALVVLAALLTDEVIALAFLGGAAIVLLGVYVGALRAAAKPEEAVEEDLHARPGVPSCG